MTYLKFELNQPEDETYIEDHNQESDGFTNRAFDYESAEAEIEEQGYTEGYDQGAYTEEFDSEQLSTTQNQQPKENPMDEIDQRLANLDSTHATEEIKAFHASTNNPIGGQLSGDGYTVEREQQPYEGGTAEFEQSGYAEGYDQEAYTEEFAQQSDD